MTQVTKFPIQGIPKEADKSQYSQRERAQNLMLLKAQAINRTATGDLPMTPELKASIEQANKALSELGYMI